MPEHPTKPLPLNYATPEPPPSPSAGQCVWAFIGGMILPPMFQAMVDVARHRLAKPQSAIPCLCMGPLGILWSAALLDFGIRTRSAKLDHRVIRSRLRAFIAGVLQTIFILVPWEPPDWAVIPIILVIGAYPAYAAILFVRPDPAFYETTGWSAPINKSLDEV